MYFMHGLGGDPVDGASASASGLISVPAREVQSALIRAGYDLGRTGADNNFGRLSIAALNAAIARTRIFVRQSYIIAEPTTVQIEESIWRAIQAFPAGSARSGGSSGGTSSDGTSARRTPATTPTETPPAARPADAGFFDSTTIGLLLAATVAVGALWYYRKRQTQRV